MKMKVKNRLTGIRAGIKHQAVAGLTDAGFAGKLVSHIDHMSDQALIPCFKVI